MKRILVLSPRYPFPAVGGDKVRLVELSRILARRYRLTLLTFGDFRYSEQEQPKGADREIFESIITCKLGAIRRASNLLKGLLSTEPLQNALFRSRAFASRLEELARAHDAILVHLARIADYVLPIAKPKVLDMTDVLSLNYGRSIATLGIFSPRRWIYKLELGRLEAYEAKVVRRFDIVTLASAEDRKYLPTDAPVVVVPNGIGQRQGVTASASASPDPVVAFIGRVDYLPNFDACEYFINDIMPLLGEAFRFRIIGDATAKALKHFRQYRKVEITGRVANLEDACAGCFAAVAPMRIASGIQNKVLEYLAIGLPAVVSPYAAAGLAVHDGRDVLIAGDATEFRAAILRLWSDPSLRVRISEAGQTFVRREHKWKATIEPLIQWFDAQLLGN